MVKLILASTSPRRKALLQQIGLTFEIDGSDIAEKLNPRLKPRGNAEHLSYLKAKAIAAKHHQLSLSGLKESRSRKNDKNTLIVIAADTIVVFNGEILGKPADKQSASKMLRKLNGRVHTVITGFTIIDVKTGKTVTKSAETKVFFRKLSLKEIEAYVKTGEPFDKAGAYGMQQKAAIFIERIEGDPFNVIGLPLQAVAEELKRFGIKVV